MKIHACRLEHASGVQAKKIAALEAEVEQRNCHHGESMGNVKQVILIDKSLGMRMGKAVAQGAHASMKVFLDRITHVMFLGVDTKSAEYRLQIDGCTKEMADWASGASFKKICLSVPTGVELLKLFEKAQEANLPCALIIDNGQTEFKGVHTPTAVAIGPAEAELIDPLTGHLKPL